MICQKCGSQLNMDGTCPNCGQGNVRIMEKSEINAYDGITIEENSYGQESPSSISAITSGILQHFQ